MGDDPMRADTEMMAQMAAENIALEAIVAVLLVEVCFSDRSPRDKLARMAAGLQGVAHGTAAGSPASGAFTLAITETVERVCAMAEKLLPTPPPER